MINKILIKGLLTLTSLVLLGCATNPITGKDELMLYSEKDDFELGRQVAPQLE